MKNIIFCIVPLLCTIALLLCASVEAQNNVPKSTERIYPRVVFPKDEAILDAKRDLGAKGDGIRDDTEALQKGLDASCGIAGKTKVLYLPNGVYKVSKTLVVKNAIGPWLYGESRDGVIIRLVDNAKDCNSVLRTHPKEDGTTSADWFMRNIRHLTIDVGNNPSTDGIRYHATNSGILQDIKVIGRGKVGINAGFRDQSGPNLVQDILIDGFETGAKYEWCWGGTLSRVTIRNASKVGVSVNATAVGIEDLRVSNTLQALSCTYPNDWTWWGGVVAITGCRFYNAKPSPEPAIYNTSVLYARNIQSTGFMSVLDNPLENQKEKTLSEYFSGKRKAIFEKDTPEASLKLPIKPEPIFPWEQNTKNWVCANDFGAKSGDNQDDTEAIQKAIDAAAMAKKTVVYLRGIGGGDPNCYNVNGEVKVHGTVRFIVGLGFGRIIGNGDKGRFVVSNASAPLVKFQNIDSFGGTPVILENQSSSKTLIVESCGVKILGTSTGDIFATDCPSLVELTHASQKMWARQLNPEGDSDVGLVQNNGADLWALGVKTEGKGIRFATRNGGRTEILGMFVYGSGIEKNDLRPLFDIENASFSIAGMREIAFDVPTWNVKVREKRQNEIQSLGVDKEGGWIGWSLYCGWPYLRSSATISFRK